MNLLFLQEFEVLRPYCYCAGAIAAEIVITMMAHQTPQWSNIASTVKTNPTTLHPKLIFERHTTVPLASSATTGIKQNRKTTKPSGGAGTCNLFMIISNRT